MQFKVIKDKLFSTGFFHVFFSTVFNKGITFIAGIVLVRILSKEQYGVYSYAYNIYSTIMLFTGMGMVSAILQVCSESENKKKGKELYNYGCRFSLLFNITLSLTMLVIALVFPMPISGTKVLLVSMAALPLIQLLPSLQLTYLRTELRNKEYSKATNLQTIMIASLTIVLCLLINEYGRIVALYISAIITFIFLKTVYHVNIDFKRSNVSFDDKKDMIKIGIISMLNTGLSELMYLIDIYVLGYSLHDEKLVAVYKVSTIIPTALAFIPLAVVVYAYPYFARNRMNKKWLIKASTYSYIGLGILNSCIGIFLYIFARPILAHVYGSDYLDATGCFKILAVNYAVSSTFRIFSGNILVSQRKLFFNFIVALISSLLNIVLNILLINIHGIEGAAIATLFTSVLSGLANTIYLFYSFKRLDNAIGTKMENIK